MDKNGETYGIGILYGKSIGKNSEHLGEPLFFLDKHHDEKAFWWKNDTGPDKNLAVTPRSSRQFLLTTALKPSQKSMSYAGEASASRTPGNLSAMDWLKGKSTGNLWLYPHYRGLIMDYGGW